MGIQFYFTLKYHRCFNSKRGNRCSPFNPLPFWARFAVRGWRAKCALCRTRVVCQVCNDMHCVYNMYTEHYIYI